MAVAVVARCPLWTPAHAHGQGGTQLPCTHADVCRSAAAHKGGAVRAGRSLAIIGKRSEQTHSVADSAWPWLGFYTRMVVAAVAAARFTVAAVVVSLHHTYDVMSSGAAAGAFDGDHAVVGPGAAWPPPRSSLCRRCAGVPHVPPVPMCLYPGAAISVRQPVVGNAKTCHRTASFGVSTSVRTSGRGTSMVARAEAHARRRKAQG